MRLFHNATVGKILAVILGLVTAGYFAWGFYYFGEWVGMTFLETVPGGPTTLGILCAVIMCLAVLYVFFYIEYIKEDVYAYEDDRGDGSFESALKQLQWVVRLLEVGSLLFRWWILSWAFSGFILVVIGLGLLWLSHILGKVLHAQANRPQDVEATRLMNKAGSRIWEGLGKHIKHLDVDQLRRVAAGDPTPLDEVTQESSRNRSRSASRAEQRRIESQEQRNQAKSFATKYLAPRATTQLNEEPNQDGPTPFNRSRQA